MSLINREDLIAEYDRVHVGEPGGARKLMVDAPEAQSEIVIPCVDCANWIPGFITDNDDFVPPKCGKYQQMVGHDSNDFCSLAERRTDERQPFLERQRKLSCCGKSEDKHLGVCQGYDARSTEKENR